VVAAPPERDHARMETTTPHSEPRELASRTSDGISVQLLWHPREDHVTVSVADSRTGEIFELGVARDRALDAFHHPFAYAA
jgi:hypothetical protein